MAQTIGTNIVMDGSETYELCQKLLKALEKGVEKAEKDKYAEMIKKIGGYVQNGGQLYFNLTPGRYADRIEDKLDEAGIPYIKMPNGHGDVAFAVKEDDRDAFMQIQEDVFAVSTEYKQTITVKEIQEAAVRNKTNLVRIKCPVNMVGILDKKIFQSHIVHAKEVSNDNEKAYKLISSESVFNTNGEDLGKVDMLFALEETKDAKEFEELNKFCGLTAFTVPIKKGSNTKIRLDPLMIRKMQANYDDARVNDIINVVMGEPVSFRSLETDTNGTYFEKESEKAITNKRCALFDAEGKSNTYLTAEKGRLFVHEKKNGKWAEPIEIEIPDELRGQDRRDYIQEKVMKYQEVINNSHFDTMEECEAIIDRKKTYSDEWKLAVGRPTIRSCCLLNYHSNGKFPKFIEGVEKNNINTIETRTDAVLEITKQLEDLIRVVSYESSKMVTTQLSPAITKTYPKRAFDLKKQCAVAILKDDSNIAVQTFFNTRVNGVDSKEAAEIKRQIFDKFLKNYDEHEEGLDLGVDDIDYRDIARELEEPAQEQEMGNYEGGKERG